MHLLKKKNSEEEYINLYKNILRKYCHVIILPKVKLHKLPIKI